MKLNSYSIFSERTPSNSDRKSAGSDQTSILRDLDPAAARFPERSVTNGRNALWGAVLLLVGGVLAWLMIHMQNGVDSRNAIPGTENAKSEIVSVAGVSSGTALREKSDGLDNSASKPSIAVASEAAVVAPAIIRGTSLGSSVQETFPEAKASVVSADNKLDGAEKDARPEPAVSTASPLIGNRVDRVKVQKVHREKNMDSHERNSRAVAVKGEAGKSSTAQANRSSQNEKQAAERDVEIITVLVK